MQMISSATSAKATTSVRRMTGGSSALLSGTGVPSLPLGGWRSPGKGFVGGDLEAEGLTVEGLAVEGLAGTGLVGMSLTMVSPARGGNDRQKPLAIRTWLKRGGDKFHRGSVSVVALDRMRRSAGRTELPAPGGVCCSRASHDAHIQRGSTMTQSIDRLPLSRVRRLSSRQRRFAGAGSIFQRCERADARLRIHPADRLSAERPSCSME